MRAQKKSPKSPKRIRFLLVRGKFQCHLSLKLQAMISHAMIQLPARIAQHAVKSKRGAGLAVLYQRPLVVKILYTAAQKVKNVTWLRRPAMTTHALCPGSRKYPQSPYRSHRWGTLHVTPPSVVLMTPPAARRQQGTGAAVLYLRRSVAKTTCTAAPLAPPVTSPPKPAWAPQAQHP